MSKSAGFKMNKNLLSLINNLPQSHFIHPQNIPLIIYDIRAITGKYLSQDEINGDFEELMTQQQQQDNNESQQVTNSIPVAPLFANDNEE